MEIAARLPWTDLGDGALTQAHIGRTLPEALRAPGPDALPTRPDIDLQPFLQDLLAELDRDAAPAWKALQQADARVVVAGQQPGCAGGTLLVLYKAATAVALARRCARTTGRPVVPVFWNATDDVDFDEIARVAWPDPDGGMGFLELPREARRSQGFVGALPAAGDVHAAGAAARTLDAAGRARVEALLPESARDHGDWVGRLLRRVFPELAVLDARSLALRRHAKPLYEKYLDAPEAIAAHVQSSAGELAAHGFPASLSTVSTRMALFLVRDGQRHKVDGDVRPLREALQTNPETIVPNVVLRPLVQDLLFPVVASVVGPTELAYLLELRGVRRALDVHEPALVPRLTMTHLDAAAWDAAVQLGLLPVDVLAEGDAAWRQVARARAGGRLQTLHDAFAQLDAALEALDEQESEAARVGRTRRRARALRDELAADVEDAALQALWSESPALASLRTMVRPRARPQERLLAGLWLLARWGGDTGPRLVEVADAHLQALDRGVVEHFVVVD
jgi:hypothetical protein